MIKKALSLRKVLFCGLSLADLVQANNVGGLGSAFTLYDIELNRFAFFEGFESIGLDRGVVYEYIATVFALDESITFFSIEPFNLTLHLRASFFH